MLAISIQALNMLTISRCHHWSCDHSTEVRPHRDSVHGWPLLLIPLMRLEKAWQGVSEVEIPTKNSPWSVTHGTPVIWLSCGGAGCQLSTRDVSGHLPTSKTLEAMERRHCPLPFEPPILKGLLITPSFLISGSAVRNWPTFGEGPKRAQRTRKAGRRPFHCLQRSN